MQQNCIETLQSDQESLKQELSLLVVGRDWRYSVAQIIQKFHVVIINNIIIIMRERSKHPSSSLQASPQSSYIAPNLFQSKLKAYLFQKSFRSQTHPTHRTAFAVLWLLGGFLLFFTLSLD